MSIIIPANSAVSGGFDVANSCMFNLADSPYMDKTQGSGNRQIFTLSTWFKTSVTGANQTFYGSFVNSSNYDYIFINDANQMAVNFRASGSNTAYIITNRLFRDVGAFYHVVVAVDTTQGTEADRIKIYINGVQETSLSRSEYPSVNTNTTINNGDTGYVGSVDGTQQYFSGYLAEVVLIDGLALAPTSFGEFDEDSGIWKPIDVSGLTFGTNGFYLDFEDSANLGNDANGGTDFTEYNLAATDQSTDTCTNNFCTLNPLDASRLANTDNTFSQGNLKITDGSNYYLAAQSTFAVTAGKWYWEVKIDATTSNTASGVGVADLDGYTRDDGAANGAFGWIYAPDGDKRNAGTSSSYGDTYAANDIIGIALDMDNLAIYFSKNGTFQASGDPTSGASKTNAAFTNLTGTVAAHVYDGSSTQAHEFSCNFGSPFYAISSGNADGDGFGNFEHAVPSGYFSLNTKNLAEYG